MKKLSKRRYSITICEGDYHRTTQNIDIYFIMDSKTDFEYIYALQEDIDIVLDMQKGVSMYFQPNRDDKNSKGIILRTS